MKQKLIIDTDPGIDDAMAIHYAFAHAGLDVLGLTTIFGNVFAWQAARNALLLSEQAHYPLDVIEGASQPLTQPLNPPSHHVHGKKGLAFCRHRRRRERLWPKPQMRICLRFAGPTAGK